MSPYPGNIKIRKQLYKSLFLAGDKLKSFNRLIAGVCHFCFTVTLFLFLISFLFYIGFNYSEGNLVKLRSTFRILLLILFLAKLIPEILIFKKKTFISYTFEILVFLFSLVVILSNFQITNQYKTFWVIFYGNTHILIAIFLIIISKMSGLARYINSINIPPGLLFSISFLIIILIGSGLLLLPNAHNIELSYLDSFFTSASAVCVTGLLVVDTATAFTTLGKIIIICLIQIGGLGIMTFTGFFSYIFTSSSSYRDRLLLKEIFSSQTLGNLFTLLTKIILLTFLTEMIGALLIYSSLDRDSSDNLFFSLFHAVSAFCNAGFSTLSEGLYTLNVRSNYVVQITVALLIILGGIGFPVLISVYAYFRHLIIILIRRLQTKRAPVIIEQRNMSIQIVLVMTVFLILAGAVFYFIFEKDNSLSGMDNTRKYIISFFGSVSARTAGFSIADISRWGYPTIFFMMLLMWIGASPGSTGGGIKTTTFAIAFRSVWNNIRGRKQLVIGNREIGSSTITRILSIIFLSILVITTGFFCLLLSEPGRNPVHLIFECVSAFGTVGLSLADTSTLSQTGKVVIILLMFIGRVGPLTLLTGMFISYQKRYSRFPETDIIIN